MCCFVGRGEVRFLMKKYRGRWSSPKPGRCSERALMTPGSHVAPGVFCCGQRLPPDWRSIAHFLDCDFRSSRNAGSLWTAGHGTDARWKYVSPRHAGRKSDWLFFPWIDRPIYAEPHGYLTGLARGHRCRFFRRLYNVFQFRLGDGQDAGRRRMATRDNVCRG